jgi:hypothetical protein
LETNPDALLLSLSAAVTLPLLTQSVNVAAASLSSAANPAAHFSGLVVVISQTLV